MNPVKVAILGCGGMAGAHARRFKPNPDVRVVALCDVSLEICEKFRARHFSDYSPAPALFTDPAAMYAQAKPDAVAIITPHTLHYQQGVQALDAGCHVLMEKPMVTSARDAYRLKAKVEASGKIFVIGYNTPCTPQYQFIRQQIREQTLGKLQLVSGFLLQGWQHLTVNTWRQKPELSGGGQAYDSGAHILNSLTWSVESNVAQVSASIDNRGAAVDINSVINVRFENGVMASITIGGACASSASGMVYAFDQGRIECDPWSGSFVKLWRGKDEVTDLPITGKATTPNDNFIDAILGRDTPRTSPLNGVIHSQLMDAIYESARTGKPARPALSA